MDYASHFEACGASCGDMRRAARRLLNRDCSMSAAAMITLSSSMSARCLSGCCPGDRWSFGDRRQLARRLEPHRLPCAWIAPPGALTVRVVSPSGSGQAECLYPLGPSGRTHIAPGLSGVGSEACVAGGLVCLGPPS